MPAQENVVSVGPAPDHRRHLRRDEPGHGAHVDLLGDLLLNRTIPGRTAAVRAVAAVDRPERCVAGGDAGRLRTRDDWRRAGDPRGVGLDQLRPGPEVVSLAIARRRSRVEAFTRWDSSREPSCGGT